MSEDKKKQKRIGRPTKEIQEQQRQEKDLNDFISQTYQRIKDQITSALNDGDVITTMNDVNQGLEAMEKLRKLSEKPLTKTDSVEEPKTISLTLEGSSLDIEEEIKKSEESPVSPDQDQDFQVIETSEDQ